MLANALADQLTGAALLVCAVALLVIGFRARHLVAEVKGVKMTMDTQLVPEVKAVKEKAERTSVSVEQINTAVNYKLPHEPTMVKRLADVEAKLDTFIMQTQRWQNDLVSKIGVDVRAANAEQSKEHP